MADKPRGQRSTRPYVRTEELAVLVDNWLARHRRSGETPHSLADRAELSPRAVTKVIRRESPLQTAWVADKVLHALDMKLSFDIEILELTEDDRQRIVDAFEQKRIDEVRCEQVLVAAGGMC